MIKPILLISDLDGTLLDAKKQIPQKAMDAICRFTEAGGYFAVATGRTEDTCRLATDILPVNVPVILYNGASVYDLKEGRALTENYLSAELFEPLVRGIMAKFPDVCTEIFAYGPVLLTNPNADMDPYIIREDQPYRFAELGNLPERWLKIMLSAPNQRLQEVESFLLSQKLAPCKHFYSAEYYYEILPQNCTKGQAAKELAKLLGVPRENVAAIGDHLNDIELLQWAGHAYVPRNAHPLTHKFAQVLRHSNDEAAIADVIEELMGAEG